MKRFLKQGSLRAVPLLALLFLILGIVLVSCVPTQAAEGGQAGNLSASIEQNQQRGRWMQALYQLEAQAAREGWSPQALRQAGDLWAAAGDLSRALPYWEAVWAADSADSELLRRLSRAYIDQQRWSQALDSLRQLAQSLPDEGWAHYQLGLIRAAFDPKTAEGHLRTAARTPTYAESAISLLNVLVDDSQDTSLSVRVGLALVEQGLWPYAELALDHAVDLGEADAAALAYLGLARDQQGKSGESRIMQAVALEPQNALVRYLEGLHWRSVGDDEASLEALRQGTLLAPDNPALYAELGEAYQRVGDLQNAERWLRVAVEMSEGDAHFQQRLALFYAETAYNLDAGGLTTLQDSTVLLPNDPDVRAGFGWALHTMGDSEAALVQLDRALEIAPNHPRALLYKARIWLETGNMEGAVRLLTLVAAGESAYQEEALRLLTGLEQSP